MKAWLPCEGFKTFNLPVTTYGEYAMELEMDFESAFVSMVLALSSGDQSETVTMVGK